MVIELTLNVLRIARGINIEIMQQNNVLMSVQMELLLTIQPGIVWNSVHGELLLKALTKLVFCIAPRIILLIGGNV